MRDTGLFIRRVQSTFHPGHRGPQQMDQLWNASWAEYEHVRSQYDATTGVGAWEGRTIFERDAADYETRMRQYRETIDAALAADPVPSEADFQASIRGFFVDRHPDYRHADPDFAMPMTFSNMLAELEIQIDHNTFWRALKEATAESPETFGRWVGVAGQYAGRGAAGVTKGFFQGTGALWGLVLVGGLAWWIYEYGRSRASYARLSAPGG